MRKHYLTITAKDCEKDTFRSGGKGGQNQNTRETGVRWRHRPSGAAGESREERSQLQNSRIAWRRMGESPKFLAWVKQEHDRMDGLERKVEQSIVPGLLKIEVKDEHGNWVPAPEDL